MKKVVSVIVMFFWSACIAVAADRSTPPQRIISLAPNVTEILFALGLGDHIVGVTSFCDYPPEARKKSRIGGMSNPSLEAVITLKPDLVVVTTDGNPREFEERLRSLNIKTFVVTARRLAEFPQGIRDLGAALGVPDRADRLAREIDDRLIKLTVNNNSSRVPRPSSRKVLFIVWPEPLLVAGPLTAMNDAIALLGHQNIASAAKSEYPKYSLEEVIRESPHVIVIGKASGMDMETVSKGILQKLTSVPAVKNGKVCYVSDNLYRIGPRIIKGIEELAECLK